MRRFELIRHEDVHGVSGTGVVAQGTQYENGYCTMTWLTPHTSVAMYHSIDVLESIHGHGGRTEVRWVDPKPGANGAWDALLLKAMRVMIGRKRGVTEEERLLAEHYVVAHEGSGGDE